MSTGHPDGCDMLAGILPAWVVSCERTTDVGEDGLFPEERQVLTKAVTKRRLEFSTVRACARQALAELGLPPVPILPGERGAPQWPDGVVGTMTHCEGYRAAALARTSQAVGLGVDAEPHGELPDGVLDLISLPQERAWLAELAAAQPAVHWDRLLFTVKESVYKVWYPITRRWLDFSGALVEFEPVEFGPSEVQASGASIGRGRFTAELQVPGPVVNGAELKRLPGEYLVANGLVISAIALARDDTG
jgi:4'-phosphopantetheinyl transferase EntD